MKWFKKEEQNTVPPIKGDLIFKCKRCEEISKLSKDWREFSLQQQCNFRYEPHRCPDGNVGIIELVGFESDELADKTD